MPGFMQNLSEVLARLTTRQKVQLALALAATIGLVWGISLYATKIRYDVLFADMSVDDASEIVSALKERNVPHRISAGGSVIEVPVEQVDELRMELASESLPRGGGVGFEIFDKPSFGLSDFVQNVNYRRALERELGRTIQSLDSVRSARVHLALPRESVFADETREASASVVVRLRSSGSLSTGSVWAIAHLVASGVEGLDPARVSVIDGHGQMLSGGDGEENAGSMSASQIEKKRGMEGRIESTLVAILEPLVGRGRVRARATVELNTARVERVEESYDPDGAVVRSEVKSKSRTNDGGSGGVPGTASNLPGGAAAASAGAAGRSDSQSSTTNFEINKTIATIAEPVGRLLRQSVAVVVDNAGRGADAAAGETDESTPRTPEEMRKITDLVRAAVGIDVERGDVLIVENVPFDESADPALEPADDGIDWIHVGLQIARYGALPLAVLLIAVLVIRPGIAALRTLPQQARSGLTPLTVGEMQARIAAGDSGAREGGLRRKLIEAAGEDPAAAALVVRGWLGGKKGE